LDPAHVIHVLDVPTGAVLEARSLRVNFNRCVQQVCLCLTRRQRNWPRRRTSSNNILKGSCSRRRESVERLAGPYPAEVERVEQVGSDLPRQTRDNRIPVCWRCRCGLCCTATNVVLRVLPAGHLFSLEVCVTAVEPPLRINLVVKAQRVKVSGKRC